MIEIDGRPARARARGRPHLHRTSAALKIAFARVRRAAAFLFVPARSRGRHPSGGARPHGARERRLLPNVITIVFYVRLTPPERPIRLLSDRPNFLFKWTFLGGHCRRFRVFAFFYSIFFAFSFHFFCFFFLFFFSAEGSAGGFLYPRR